MSKTPLRLAVLISGGGRTLVNLAEHIKEGKLNARIVAVVCSRAGVKGIARAEKLGLGVTMLDRTTMSDEDFQRGITESVAGADLVCMAGFLSLWRIPDAFLARVMNIHPALLPEFGGNGMYGMRVHQAVLEAGKRETGCTVHFCDNQYDHGPIILQRKITVKSDDTEETLADRVFQEECLAYPEAVKLFAEGRIQLRNHQVEIKQD